MQRIPITDSSCPSRITSGDHSISGSERTQLRNAPDLASINLAYLVRNIAVCRPVRRRYIILLFRKVIIILLVLDSGIILPQSR